MPSTRPEAKAAEEINNPFVLCEECPDFDDDVCAQDKCERRYAYIIRRALREHYGPLLRKWEARARSGKGNSFSQILDISVELAALEGEV